MIDEKHAGEEKNSSVVIADSKESPKTEERTFYETIAEKVDNFINEQGDIPLEEALLSLFQVVEQQFYIHNFRTAKTILEVLVQRYSTQVPSVYFEYAIKLFSYVKNLDGLSLLFHGIGNGCDDFFTRMLYGEYLLVLGNTKEALEEMEQLLSVCESYWGSVCSGFCAYASRMLQEYQKSRIYCSNALKNDPYNAKLYYERSLATLCWAREDVSLYEDAYKDMEQVVHLAPYFVDAHCYRVKLLLLQPHIQTVQDWEFALQKGIYLLDEALERIGEDKEILDLKAVLLEVQQSFALLLQNKERGMQKMPFQNALQRYMEFVLDKPYLALSMQLLLEGQCLSFAESAVTRGVLAQLRGEYIRGYNALIQLPVPTSLALVQYHAVMKIYKALGKDYEQVLFLFEKYKELYGNLIHSLQQEQELCLAGLALGEYSFVVGYEEDASIWYDAVLRIMLYGDCFRKHEDVIENLYSMSSVRVYHMLLYLQQNKTALIKRTLTKLLCMHPSFVKSIISYAARIGDFAMVRSLVEDSSKTYPIRVHGEVCEKLLSAFCS